MAERLLIVEDEETLRESLKRVLSREGYTVSTCESAESALRAFEEGFFDLVLTDIILPGITGIELLKRIKESLPQQIVVIMTAYASLETAVDALRSGAYDYVVKPVMHEEIKQVVRNALRQGALQEENTRLRRHMERHYDLNTVIGVSPAMQRIMAEVRRIAATAGNVLLLGEVGTGKEFMARTIHVMSSRAEKPFITVNLRSFPGHLHESVLFGHVKGAFSGATASRKGLLEEANSGTVFLREVGDLSPAIQEKLLDILKARKMRAVGGTEEIAVDLRFIAASNRSPESLSHEGVLIKDLLKGTESVTIVLPPLRERKEDIEPLVNHFLKNYATDLCRNVACVDRQVLESFTNYDWPGNVRELQNIIERTVLLSDSETIGTDHLPLLGLQK